MSASWGSVQAGDYLSHPAGDFAGTGAYTMAALVRPDGSNNARLCDWFASATEKGQLLLDTGGLYGKDDFSSGFGALASTSAWYLFAITKASGSATYRMHYWAYAAAGTGTMSHGVATGAATHANESPAATTVRTGWSSGASIDGDVAVAAWWDRALSDADLDSLKSGNLSAWSALAPDLGVHYGSWTGTTGDVVFAGSSGTATKTGTVGSAANPSGFSFTLGPATVTATAVGTQAGTGTAVANVRHGATAVGTQAGTGTAVAKVKHLATAAGTEAGSGTAAATVKHPATAVGTQAGTGSAVATPSTPGGTVTATATGTQASSGTAVATVIHRGTASSTGAGTGTAAALVKHPGTAYATNGGTGTAVALVTVYATAAGTQAGTGSAIQAGYVNPYGRVPSPTPGTVVPIDVAEVRVPVDAAEARTPSPA